ncbi:hypothetical protein [Flavihumibacter fluvii]|uniref:hypothetical protein n=1 Tax=Flavihumibacter fluvii TaxID=2838157 RepID=UPI001BDEA689|nr:hypothetical protein [Flavihumibacter fluvii]ULQ51998.1 hypothetical protein KJS93_18055 [Flavihumibacter fluvii]
MKKATIALVLVLAAFYSNAQSNKEDIAIIQSMFGKEKKELVAEYMSVPAAQQEKFWSLYDDYEDKRKALGRERISLIEEYANNYAALDDKKATELTKNKFSWASKFNKLQESYFSKFAAVIGGRNAAKLMQLEDYLENNIRLTIQEEIPFIDEIEKRRAQAGSK